MLLTDKKFESCDDEILLKELFPKKPREITDEEEIELEKTLKYSNIKLYDAFNLGKSIWNIAYDSVTVSLKRNKDSIVGAGFVVYHQKEDNNLYVWEYQIKKAKKDKDNYKLYLTKIHDGPHEEETLNNVIETESTWKDVDFVKKLPVFEVKCEQKLPLEQTIIPMVRRKILSFIYQSINLNKSKNFDNIP
jgi:hypothetical protein